MRLSSVVMAAQLSVEASARMRSAGATGLPLQGASESRGDLLYQSGSRVPAWTRCRSGAWCDH